MLIFSTKRQEEEFENKSLDDRLRLLVYFIWSYIEYNYKRDMVITDIYRYKHEQDQIYKDNPEYKKKPWDSVHQYWRGLDFRSAVFNQSEINNILDYINKIVPYGTPGHFTLICHNVGSGMHFHLQVNSLDRTIIQNAA